MNDSKRFELGMGFLRSLYTPNKSNIQQEQQIITPTIPDMNKESKLEPFEVPFIRTISTKIVQNGQSTDFVGTPLFASEIDRSVRDKTEYHQSRGKHKLIPRYQVVNDGNYLKTSSFLPMEEGLYRNIVGGENRLNRPYEHSAMTSIKNYDMFHALTEGKPIISNMSNGFNTFYIQDTVQQSVIEELLKESLPQHNVSVVALHNSTGRPDDIYLGAKEDIENRKEGRLDANVGQNLWGKDLNIDAAIIVANIASIGLDIVRSGRLDRNNYWIQYPWINDEKPGVIPYYGLLLGQLGYHLLSPISDKLLPENRRHLAYPMISTTPGFGYKYELVTEREKRSMGTYLKPTNQVKTEPVNKFAEELAQRIVGLNNNHDWNEAYPQLRQHIQANIQ